MGEETQKTELEKLGFELVERNSDDCKKSCRGGYGSL